MHMAGGGGGEEEEREKEREIRSIIRTVEP